MFKAVCKLGLEGIVSKKLDAPYRLGPTKNWLKIKNPNAPAAIVLLMGRSDIRGCSIGGQACHR
jgi:ATP-dependent DNA ligase